MLLHSRNWELEIQNNLENIRLGIEKKCSLAQKNISESLIGIGIIFKSYLGLFTQHKTKCF